LGTLPVDYPLMPGSLLIFGGRRWKVLAVDSHARVVELVRSSGGRPPQFAGGGGEVADEVRQEMLRVYTTANVPAYLDRTAVALLAEGRANFARFGLGNDPLLPHGKDLMVFPWRGDRICDPRSRAHRGRHGRQRRRAGRRVPHDDEHDPRAGNSAARAAA
jgi:ATP-dependent Lhr-like helicase